MTLEDIGAGLSLCRASRWNQIEEDWRFFLEGGQCWLVEKDRAVVGTVAVLRYGAAFSWLAMMLVDPQQRRSGIGSMLMKAALDALAREACVRLDATPAGEPLYRRFEFVPEYELSRIKVTVNAARLQPLPGSARRMEPVDLPEVFARDLQVFGADRSSLLTSFYRRAPEFAWVSSEGYCFGRQGHLYNHLGPIVGDQEEARQLVTHCLSAHDGGAFAIDITDTSPERIPWLHATGFELERTFVRMRRGQGPPQPRDAREFAIAGPEFA